MLTGNEVLYDTDGDIPIRFGSTQVFVRSSEEAPVVRVFAILITDLSLSAACRGHQRAQPALPVRKFFWDGRSVVMSIDVPATRSWPPTCSTRSAPSDRSATSWTRSSRSGSGTDLPRCPAPEPDEGLSGGYLDLI